MYMYLGGVLFAFFFFLNQTTLKKKKIFDIVGSSFTDVNQNEHQ